MRSSLIENLVDKNNAKKDIKKRAKPKGGAGGGKVCCGGRDEDKGCLIF